MKWSRKYQECIKCKKSISPHKGKGLCRHCYDKKYYTKEWWRKYYNKNRTKRIEASKKNYRLHYSKYREKDLITKAKYRKTERYKKSHKKYEQSPKGKQALKNVCHRRRGNLKNAGKFTAQEWEEIKQKFNYRCAMCGKKRKLTQDHIRPLTKNGLNIKENVQPLCKSCNSKKGNKIL